MPAVAFASRRTIVRLAASAAAVALGAGALAVAGPAKDGKDHAHVKAPAASPAAAAFGRLKGLAGTWEMEQEGKKQVAAVFKVTAAGSVVHETMFPGSEHEMINMYHLDGETLVLTHYCAAGNQPRMQCAEFAKEGSVFVFQPRDVTNLKAPGDGYMGSMTLTLVDANSIRQAWRQVKSGQSGEGPTFTLTRKPG